MYGTASCQQRQATHRHLDKLRVGYTIVDLTAPESAELLTWITDDLG